MTLIPTGPGFADVKQMGAVRAVFLYNFDNDGDEVKEVHHKETLRPIIDQIVRVERNHVVHMHGHASRRGPTGYNVRLSLRRLEKVRAFLRSMGVNEGRFRELTSFPWGEEVSIGGTIDERKHRSVLLLITRPEVPVTNIRLSMPDFRDDRDVTPPELRVQGRLYLQRLGSVRVQVASIVPGVASVHARASYFMIWDPGRHIACDYFFLAGEGRLNLGSGAVSVRGGVASTGDFSRIWSVRGRGPVTLGVHEFGGPARGISGRVGLPSGIGGPGSSGTAFFMYPIIRGGPLDGYVSLLSGGSSAGSLSSAALAGTTGDLIMHPRGPYVLPGAEPADASSGRGAFDE